MKPLAVSVQRLRGFLPIVTCLVLVACGLAPVGLPHFATISPALALMAVFYWSIFRADLMSMLGAFLIGLVVDLITAGPLGLNALLLLLTHELGVSQRRVFLGSSFLVNWWGFAMVAVGASLISWSIASLLHWQLHEFRPVLAQLALSLGLYPAIYWLLSRIEQRYLRPGLST
ncbi:rod shape-determining protein MreD [Ferrovibrio sp.]|uniref:rod shape-determining protein MreD n=1 Tax=Ferrovibrio sp. TaxID=1917215 RepID=UPI001B54D872|nr:rod shape-determining protein MreD [Ferrovibrio sp.]MBP7063534.1 rod shape-determining protein MreD [Ferrovibrio sp.]